MSDPDLEKSLKKACSIEETAPKRKHLRACIVYSWDHKSARAIFQTIKAQPFVNDEVQLFKMLIVIHKVIQEGHPSALKEAIRDREWIRSLGRIHPNGGSSSYAKLIREYVKYLVRKLNFHANHKGFRNGTFEYEEYVSLVSVADPDEGYETIIELMNLQDAIDDYSQLVFATIQHDSRNSDCKISSLIPMVSEAYGIYKFITSMLRAMYSQLGEDDQALAPLKERYELQHIRLFEFFADCSSIKYLTTLVAIPRLPTEPPNIYKLVGSDSNGTEIKFQRKSNSATPTNNRSQERLPSPAKNLSPPERTVTPTRSSSGLITPMVTSGTAAVMIPTVTAAANMVPMMTGVPSQQQQQAAYWAEQNAQYANEQARLEQERQRQLQEQQQQQQLFQQQLRNAEQEMMKVQLQQQSQQQNDLLALTNQYERDQNLLQQYDQRVQQLESEINTMNQNASSQLSNKDDQIQSLSDQMQMWEKKYESLAKLYSQLRQEHLQLLPKFKKLQVKVNSAHEAIREKEKIENKMKQKDIHMADLIKERDRLRIENDRSNNISNSAEIEANKNEDLNTAALSKDKINLIVDACLESGIATIQESLFNLDTQGTWNGPLTTASHLVTLTESASEKATEFATSFNDLILDGAIDGDQATVVFNISEFSTVVASLVTTTQAFASYSLNQGESDDLIDTIKKCAREAQYFFEDLMSDNLESLEDDEAKTDLVINANVDMQEKLQQFTVMLEPYMNIVPKSQKEKNAHSELVATAENIQRSSEILRVNVDVDVPKPILSLSLAIIDAIVALVKSAIDCQNEIASTTKIPLSQFYLKNSRWTEGLISAAKTVGTATNLLISTAGNIIGDAGTQTSPEEFIVASKEVAASTAQLVAASRVKTMPHSRAQNKLEGSSKEVSDACRKLVTHVMSDIEKSNKSEEMPLEFNSDHSVKTAEMEQQVTILRLEQALNNARKRLGEIRKHAYYLDDDEENTN